MTLTSNIPVRGPANMVGLVNAAAAPGPLPSDVVNKAVRVRAFVCPYGIANSYGERMELGAFDEFIARLEDMGNASGGYAIPMHIMHEAEWLCGAWTKIWTDANGLWAEGYLDKEALPVLERNDLHEVSMSWASATDVGEGAYKVTQARLDSGTVSTRRRVEVVPEVCKAEGVGMGEISLVDRGAFPGTHWEIINDDVEGGK